MKKDKLVSMVEFIGNHAGKYETMAEGGYAPQMAEKLDLYENYANFLETSLNLSMFVPCEFVGGEWVVLEEPKDWMQYEVLGDVKNRDITLCVQFQKAKELVLFDNVKFDNLNQGEDARFYFISDIQIFNMDKDGNHLYWHHYTIESIISDGNPTLTQNGLKQSGL
jgi:hypothetical protein